VPSVVPTCNEAHEKAQNCNGNRQVTAKEIAPDNDRAANKGAPLAVELPADLAGLAAIWPKMPDHIRAAILALTGTVKP
jgi:hypothetical protein